MKNISKFLKAIIAVCTIFAASPLLGVQVVVNPDSSISSISSSVLKNILTGKERFWENGSSIELAVPQGNALESEVLSNFAGMDASRFKTHWRRLVFSGRAKSPNEIAADAAMIEFVLENDNAIGFLPAGADTGGLKVISVSE